MPKPNPTLNQVYANNAQVVNISTALETAKFLLELSRLSKSSLYDSSSEVELWKLRAYTFLNRACELECVPVHKRLVETSNGLEEAWYTWVHVPLFYPDFDCECDIESVFLGYCSTMTESQARIRALS